MNRLPVESSALAAIGYDATSQTLEIEFHPNQNGTAAVWSYAPVEASLHAELLGAESIGKLFFSRIKNNPEITATKVADIHKDEPVTP